MAHDSDPGIKGITESWANKDITDAEFGLEGYLMFRNGSIGRRGGGVLLYGKYSIRNTTTGGSRLRRSRMVQISYRT